jgi:hypothetical protein
MTTWNVIRSGLLTMIKSWTERDSSRNEDRNDYLFVCLTVFNDTFNNKVVIYCFGTNLIHNYVS